MQGIPWPQFILTMLMNVAVSVALICSGLAPEELSKASSTQMYSDSCVLFALPTVELCAMINPLYSIVHPTGHWSLPGMVRTALVLCTSHTEHGIGRDCVVELLRYCAAYTVAAADGASCDALSDGELVKQSILVPPPYMAIFCCRPLVDCLLEPGPAA